MSLTFDAGIPVVGVAALAAFAAAFHFSGLVGRVRTAVRSMREAVAVFTDADLTDAAKERLLRRGALELFGHAARIALASGLVLAAPGAVLWVGDATGQAPFAASLAFLSSWEVIVGGTVAVVAVLVLTGKRR